MNQHYSTAILRSPAARLLSLALAALLTFGGALVAPPAQLARAATTITVTTTADELNSDGDCSLREAIQAANGDIAVDACAAGSGADTVVIPAGTYTRSLAGANENANATGDLDITSSVTIQGAGAGVTIVDGVGSTMLDSVFHIVNAVNVVTLSDLTIRNGNNTTGVGGGINSAGSLTLNRVAVSNNSARRAGGINSTGAMVITNSTINNNTAPYTGSGSGVAGGFEHSGLTLYVANSTISDNTSGYFNPTGNFRTQGTTTVIHTTISNNTQGGILNAGGTLTISNSLVVNNTGNNCNAAPVSNGRNISSDASCAFAGPGDANSTNALLGALASNGGGMLTRLPLAGSPAINAIPNGTSGCGTTTTIDQRGTARPQGAACEIGAIELIPIAGLSASNNGPALTGVAVAFSASVTAGDGVSYTWNFGDSLTGTGAAPTHAYAAAGSYTATVTAANGAGSTTATTAVTINSPTVAPTINSAAPLGGTYGSTYSHTFTASGTAPIAWAVIAGTLPPGLTLNSASGLLSGTPTQAGSYAGITVRASNGTLPNATQTFGIVIAKAPLTVAANPQTKIYGDPLPALTYGATGLVNGDTAATALTGALATSATAGSPVGSYSIDQGTLAAANYTIGFTPATLMVSPAPLTIAASPQTKIYGDPLPALTYTVSGLVNGDTAAGALTGALATTATASSPVGSYPITQGTLAAANYTISFTPATLTIGQHVLTITANAQTKLYGAANPALTYTVSGLVNGDTAAGALTGALATTATASSPVGSYPITQGTLAAANYTIVFNPGTLAVNPAPLAVAASAQTKVYGAANPALTYTVSGLVNGDTAAGALTGALATTATASSPVGSYPITQGALAAANYTISFTPATLTIGPAPLTITAISQVMTTGAAVPPLTASYSGLVNGDTAASLDLPVSLSTTATSASPPGSYPIVASGAADPNYTITFINGVLTVLPPNVAPSFSSAPGADATVGQMYSYQVTAADPNAGDSLTIAALAKPAWLTLAPAGAGAATLSGTPGSGDLGSYAVVLRVTDGGGLSAVQSFSVYVRPAAQSPCAGSALRALLATPGPVINLNGACRYVLTDPAGLNGHLISLFYKNNLTINGNGATIERSPSAGPLGLLALIDSSNVTIRDVALVGGQATAASSALGGRGGGLLLYNSANVTLSGVRFFDNRATLGGGLSSSGGSTSVVNGVFADNQATLSGAAFFAQGPATVDHSTFTSGVVNPREALFTWEALAIRNSIIANHATGIAAAGGSPSSEDYTLFANVGQARRVYNLGTTILGGGHSFAADTIDQQFVDPAGRDYHLRDGALAIDRGAAASGADADGRARPFGGGYADLGAYEFQGNRALVVNKRGPAWVKPNATFTFELTVANRGPVALANLRVRDTLPAGIGYAGGASAGGSFDGQSVIWQIGALAAGEIKTFQYQASASQTATSSSYEVASLADASIRAVGPPLETQAGSAIVASLQDLRALGFAPQSSGFGFGNWSGAAADGDLTAASLWTLFGPGVCAPGTGATAGSCVLTGAAEQYRRELLKLIRGGRSFGMAAASLQLFLGAPLPGGQSAPADFQPGAASTHELLRGAELQRAIALYQAGQASLGKRAGLATDGTPRAVVSFLQQHGFGGPAHDDAFTLSIRRPGGGAGRALVPYALESRAPDQYWLHVYDPNESGAADRIVAIDTAANTWAYLAAGAPTPDYQGDAASRSIFLRSLADATDLPAQCGFCDQAGGAAADSMVTFAMIGAGRFTVVNAAGQRTGYDPSTGGYINEIPGAALDGIEAGAELDQPLVVRAPLGGAYTVALINGASSSSVDFSIASPGVVASLSGLKLDAPARAAQAFGEPAVYDQASLTFDAAKHQIGFQASARDGDTPVLALAVDQAGGASYRFEVSGVALAPGRSVAMAFDAATGQLALSDTDAGQTQRYNLAVARVEPGGASQSYQRDDVTGGAGAGVVISFAGWDGASAPATTVVPNRLYLPRVAR